MWRFSRDICLRTKWQQRGHQKNMPADQETLYLLTNGGDMTPSPPDLTLGSAVLPTHCASHQVSLPSTARHRVACASDWGRESGVCGCDCLAWHRIYWETLLWLIMKCWWTSCAFCFSCTCLPACLPACLVSPLVVSSPVRLNTRHESPLVYAASSSAVVRSGGGEGAPSDGDVHGTPWSRLREEVRHHSNWRFHSGWQNIFREPIRTSTSETNSFCFCVYSIVLKCLLSRRVSKSTLQAIVCSLHTVYPLCLHSHCKINVIRNDMQGMQGCMSTSGALTHVTSNSVCYTHYTPNNYLRLQ